MNNVTSFRRAGKPRARANPNGVTRVYLLGVMRAVGSAGENVLPRAKKTQAVLACLCLARGERLLRNRIAGMIWDRTGEIQARDSLRHALYELDRLGGWRIDADHETISLDIGRCWIDAFETPQPSDLLLDSLYGLSPSFDQWLLAERNRFEARWQAALERELEKLTTSDSGPEPRAAAARKLLNFVPTHESAVRALMKAFAEMDERAQAIREYERFRAVLGNSLGMSPSEKTVALYDMIRLESRIRTSRLPAPSEWRETSAEIKTDPDPASGDPCPHDAAPACDLPPSVAVLPFRNLSGDASHDHVCEGLTEDLVEVLSRIPALFVVSRLSAAVFRHQDRAPVEIGEALGVRYLLSGSARIAGDQVRVVVELTDATTGAVLTIARLDEKCTDLLELQARLARTVVHHVAPQLRSAELKRVGIKRTEHQDAYELLLRAQDNMHRSSREDFETAEQLFDLAIARDGRYAAALAWRAYWHVMRVGQGWSPDLEHDAEQAEEFVKRAIECDPGEPMAFAVQGHVATFLRKDFDLAFAALETALRINPNCPRAWLWSANAHAYMGEGAPAVDKVNQAMSLSPYDPLVCAFSGGASLAYLADGQYDRAIEFALRCIRQNRSYSAAYRLLIVSLVLAGRMEEASSPVHQLLLLEPGFTVEENRRRFPGSAWPFGDRYSEALFKAGIPLSA